MSAEQQSVSVGERVSVSCNVSGYPYPELHWINKHNGRTVVGSKYKTISQLHPLCMNSRVFGAFVFVSTLPRDTSAFLRVCW